jgi:hypothetical protein
MYYNNHDCRWHFVKAIKEHCKGNPKVMKMIEEMRQATSKAQFWTLLKAFNENYGKTKEGIYFLKYFGKYVRILISGTLL